MPERPYLISWWLESKARKRVVEWVKEEWQTYADKRNESQREDARRYMHDEGCAPGSWWFDRVSFYLDRTRIFEPGSPEAKQAVMKAAATVLDLAATYVEVWGDPPRPGYPSGEIHE